MDWLHYQIDFGKLFALNQMVEKKPKLNNKLRKQQIINKLEMEKYDKIKNNKIYIIKKEVEAYKKILEEKEKEDYETIIQDQIEYDDIPEFTDVTAFNERGQRIEFGEVLGNENELNIANDTNSEIYDSIANYLNISIQENINEKDEDLMNIRYVINTIINIMGISIDISRIDTKCLSLYRDNYKTLSTFKKKKSKEGKSSKSIEKQHQEYNQKNLIYITSCYLLIYLQITLKNLMVLPFEKCIPKLSGFPLEEETTFGIEYMVCILSNFKNSQGIWSVLEKRETINKNFTHTIKKILTASLKLRLEQRFKEIEMERLLIEEQNQKYVWNEFRPPFMKLGSNLSNTALDLGDTDITSKSSISKSINILKNNRNLISLCIVDKINSIIENQPLENILYDPLPIGNSCCLVNINNDYNYLGFLNNNDKDKSLNKLIYKSREMDKFKDNNNDLSFYIIPTEEKIKINSYSSEVYLGEEEIDRILTKGTLQEKTILQNLYKNYIETGETGKKFYNKYDYLTKSEVNQLKDVNVGSKSDIMLLISQIKENNKIDDIPSYERNDNDEYLLKQVSCLRNILNGLDNDLLKENEFNLNIISQLDKITDKINDKDILKYWRLLDNSISVTKEKLYSKLIKNVSDKNKTDIKKNLNNILNFEKIEKEEALKIDDNDIIIEKKIHLNNLVYKRKEEAIKKYIFSYLVKYSKLLTNIDNKSKLIVENERFYDKKLVEEEQSFLMDFFQERNQKYFSLITKILQNIKGLKNIKGYEDTYGCNIKLNSSVFDYEKSSKLLELNFYFILNYIIDVIDNYEDSINKNSGKSSDFKSIDDDEEEIMGLDKKGLMIRHFIIDLMKKINKDRIWYNRHTQEFVEKKIKTMNEESKDKNLYVMEILDLEERKLRSELIKAGITQYATLASDYSDLLKQDEVDKKLMAKLEEELGTKPSDELFADYKIENEKNIREEMQIMEDNIVYVGEDEGVEDEYFNM